MFITPYLLFIILLWVSAWITFVLVLINQAFHNQKFKDAVSISAKLVLVFGTITAFSYLLETFLVWYSGNEFARYLIVNQLFGKSHFWSFWLLIFSTGIVVQPLWYQQIRNNIWWVSCISVICFASMWLLPYQLSGLMLVNP